MLFQHRLFRLCLFTILGSALLISIAPSITYSVNLLVNGPFESFESYNGEDWRGYPESVGEGWNVTVIEEDGLHFMDSHTFGQFLTALFGVPFLNYHLEGDRAQAFASRRAFDFVLWQTVNATPGQAYAFGGKVVTFWKGAGGERNDNKIFKRIGVDPTGGANHSSANVIWTEWDGTDNAWTSPALATTAQAGQMTVFIRVENTEPDVGPAHLNTGYIDNFKFELAPVANLSLPNQAAPGPVNVSWSVTIPDSGFWGLWGYDVEMKDDVSNTWQTLQTHDDNNGDNSAYIFTGEAGRTYTFRVRAWQQEAPGGSPITTAMPGLWQEKSITIGQAVKGRTIDHAGVGLSGVTVAVSGSTTSTLSRNGSYNLPTGADGDFEIVAGDFNGLVAPPAAVVTVPPAGLGQLDLMLRPTGAAQGIINNDFEIGLSGWNASNGAAVEASTLDRHSGQRSLLISDTVSLSQTNNVSNMDRPLLSFWYKSNASFTVEFLGDADAVRTATLSSAVDWTHIALESGLGDNYSGQVGVNFYHLAGSAAIFIDEVSIGAGPLRTYLPLIRKVSKVK